MKILRIVSSGFEEGGVENGIVLMQPIFEKKGHEIRIMASDKRMDLPRFETYTFKSVNPNSFRKYIYYIYNPSSHKLLKKVLKEYQPDIVHLHTMGQVTTSVLNLLKKTPTILTVHGPEAFTKSLLPWYLPLNNYSDRSYNLKKLTLFGKLHYFYYRVLMRYFYKKGLKNVNTIVTLSHYMQNLISSDGISNVYIPNGVVLLKEKKIPYNKVIIYSGRLEKFKGVDYLIHAMREILQTEPTSHLMIAGEGSYKSELESLTKDLGITKNVTFLGHLPKEKIHEVYENADVLVMPSIWPEAFGKVGIEAMSVGRPVIATDVGGVTDWLIDGVNGYLVPPKNSIAIADAVIKLLQDKNKLLKMSVHARKKAQEFSLENHVNLMTDLYQKVIADHKINNE